MKGVITAIVAVAAGLVAANMLGTASAEAPTTGPTGPSGAALRTVSVQGVASAPLEQGANAATATGVYRQAMASAVTDGQGKAEFLASKVGATLGAVQSVAEGGGSIECKNSESGYVQYEGERPDFGHAESGGALVPPAAAPAVKERAKPKRRSHKKTRAKSAVATGVTCALSTQVALVYAID
jgi:hypothetical protein